MRLSVRCIGLFLIFLIHGCQKPKEDVVFKHVQGVVVDATDKDPRLKANAVFFNPNDMKGKLKKMELTIYVDGKKAGEVDQKLALTIPAKAEFTIPVEVKLDLKELGLLNTLFSILGSKKMEVHFVGSIRLTHKGFPINVPVDYKSEIRIKF